MTQTQIGERMSPKLGVVADVQKAPIRLNLGGAGEGIESIKVKSRLEGFLTVDLRDIPDTDVVCDVSKLTPFEDGTVDACYASNVLEHFSHLETVDVLKEWCRVLKPGGKLYVSVPDFDHAVKLYLKVGLVPWLVYHLWGDQKHELNYHYTCFTFATLANAINEAGFSDVKRVKTFGFGEDGSCNVDNITGQLISVNVEATK